MMSPDLSTPLHTLEAQRQQAQALFTEAPVPYLLLNRGGQIEAVNIRGCALFERVAEDLDGHSFVALLTPESQAEVRCVLEQAFETRLPQRVAAELPKGNAPLPVMLDLVADELGGCRVVVTETLQAILPVRPQTTGQDGDRELETVIMALIQQLHLPLARALNFLSLLRRSLGAALPRALEQTEQAVQSAISLVTSLERYMQVRHLPGRGRLRRVDLQQVWREVLRDAQPLMADRTIAVTCDPLPTVQGDSQALTVILGEYCNNAVKFTRGRPEAQIHLQVLETATDYHLGLRDNGVGFNMQQQGKLFQVFGRLHPSRTFEGSGVGLASARRIAQQFGGRVWAEGQVNQGATFWVAWPKIPALPA